MNARIVVHGGAGFWRRDIRLGREGVQKAASAGSKVLADGGSALDAVETAVSVMEDDPIFNAGKGSALTCIGTVEMDAAIMDGRDLSAGAVTLIRNTKNPVHLARIVMEHTDHVLFAGKTAEKLGKAYGLPTANPITARRRRAFDEMKRNPAKGRLEWLKRNPRLIREHPEILGHDTVGAVAVDIYGNFASAASTGGTPMKLPGRIGDTPLIGSGLYSDNQTGTATATGLGEIAVKLALSRTTCLMMGEGLSATRAAEACVRMASARLHGHAGIIAIDPTGEMAAVHNTAYMPWAYSTPTMGVPKANFRGKIVSRLR